MIHKSETKGASGADSAQRTKVQRWAVDVRLELARAVVERGLRASETAQRLGVPYTTALEWVKRYRAGGAGALESMLRAHGAKIREKNEARRAAILATKAREPEAGSRRIRDVMKRFLGIGASATTVRRVLRSEGVHSPVAVKGRVKRKEMRFERAEPNQLWQSDLFTFLLRRHERIYVAAFLDDHSRYLVSLCMAHHQRSTLVLEALARGIAEYGAPREILTDQGRQYTAWRGSTEFEVELKRHGIAHVKSRPHHPQTCGKIERFWKTLWEELLSRTVFADFEDCQRRVALFIQHYNFQRPHQALQGLTPADRFFRASSPVRSAIEAQVSDNALRLARAQPARQPFYLVGRLGDRDLTISASGAALKVRVGADETTIPFLKEHAHDYGTSTARWQGGRSAAEAAPPYHTEVAEELEPGGGGAQPLPAAVVGALGGEAGNGGDRAGEDLARHLLPARDQSAQGDASGDEPDGEHFGERGGGPVGGDGPHRAARGAGEASGAGEAPCTALAAADAQVPARPADNGPPRPLAQGTHRPFDGDVPWRELALRWERKLCGENMGAAGENADECAEVELHPDTHLAARADATPGGDRGGARRDQDGLASGTRPYALAQPLSVDPASGAVRDDRLDHAQARRAASAAQRAHGAAEGAAAVAAPEHTTAAAGAGDRGAAHRGRESAQGAHSPDGTPATSTQEQHSGHGAQR